MGPPCGNDARFAHAWAAACFDFRVTRAATRCPQHRHDRSALNGSLTHPISPHPPHERLSGMNGPLALLCANAHALEVLRFIPWKMIDRFEKPLFDE